MDITDYKLPGEKKKKKKKPTLRFELDLPDSTDTSCPEYSYIDLVRQTLKERESKGQNDKLCQNLLEEVEKRERDDAKAIAQYFEIKYGATAAGHKRKRKDEVRDLVGAGYGYDENDPFVDDSEAYDEIVPASMTTQHGGFYINRGKLNFRSVSDESDTGGALSDDSIPLSHHIGKKKKKKFKLLDSDESGSEFKNGEAFVKKRKKKMKSSEDPDKKKLKVSLNGKEKVPGLKQRTKKMKKSTSLAQKLVAKAKAQQMMNASAVSAHSTNGVQQLRKSLSDQDGSAFKMKNGELGHLGNSDIAQVVKDTSKTLTPVGSNNNGSMLCLDQNGIAGNSTPTSVTKVISHELPPNLPQMLGDKIESLKKIAQSNEVAGKMKFFSNDVNKILLGIEESAQSLPNKKRQGMYQHLAQHLPCSKDTLLKRVKKLQEDDSDQQMKGPISKLKAAIDVVMKSQIEAYLMECDTNKMEKFPDKAAASTDEDDEGEDKGVEASAEKKRNYAPRRKFKWDDNMRQLLCDVVLIKVNYYEKFKSRLKQGAEEYLKAFLDSAIKPLWPKPWMQTRNLFKESKSVHERITINCPKQKKASTSKKAQATSSKDGKTPDSDANPKSDIKNSAALLAKPNDELDPLKKRLSFNLTKVVNASPAVVKPKDFGPTVSVVKHNISKADAVEGRSGGLEMVASIAGDDFERSILKKVSPKNQSATKDIAKQQWKSVPGNDLTSKSFSNPSQTVVKASSGKDRDRVDLTSKTLRSGIDMMPMDLAQEYASDFVKMMMSSSNGNTPNPYLNSSGVPNFEALSHLLDRESDLASTRKPKTPVSDGKFQFKIAPNPINSSKVERTSKGFHPTITSAKNHAATHYNVNAWSPKKASPLSGSSSAPNSVQKFATSSSLSGRSMTQFHDAFTGQTRPVLPAGFALPSDVTKKFVTQRKQKPLPTSKPNLLHHKTPYGADPSPRTLKKPSPSNPANSMQVPTSRQPYPDTSYVQSPSHPLKSPHPASPILLSPFSSTGMPFSPGFNPQISPFRSPTFTPPSSTVCTYPTVSLQNINYHATHSYPQVKLVDVKNLDLKKRMSDGLHSKQDR